jgi:hypothetical protein
MPHPRDCSVAIPEGNNKSRHTNKLSISHSLISQTNVLRAACFCENW